VSRYLLKEQTNDPNDNSNVHHNYILLF